MGTRINPLEDIMRLLLLPLAALLVMTGLPLASEAQEPVDTRPGVAVLPFTSGGSFGRGREDLQGLEVGAQQLLLLELLEHPGLRIVERSHLREILDEHGLTTGGQVDPRTAAQIGRLVGARYIVTGSFLEADRRFNMTARIFDVETGVILRARRADGRRQDLFRMIVDLSNNITRDLSLPPLQGSVAQAQQQRARAIPAEAVMLYSEAQLLEDLGEPERAIELYRQIVQRFPEMNQAREALRQLTPA
jgi:TolB-like protein